jgi:predicted acetylornithine/succinylornithine family transaminase
MKEQLTLDQHIMHTYARHPVTLTRGEGVYVWDIDGKRYLDCLGGIAVNAVGHCHPKVVKAIQEQAATLMHTSNLFHTEPQNRLADRLIETTNGDFTRIFFSNSGAEANEAALKIGRKWGKRAGSSAPIRGDWKETRAEKTKIVSATGSFHGRTFGTLSATAKPQYQEPFAPLVPDFVHVQYNDLDALQDAVDESTCAVILEPIQGESGIHPADGKFLKYARTLCDKFGALLIFDEIQCGLGRTGFWWAYQMYGVIPDVMTSAKGLGGGLPIGATLARAEAADVLAPGDHGSTFAGNAVTTSAALATIEAIDSEGLIANAAQVGDYMRNKLSHELSNHIAEVRGSGLMLGVELKEPIAKKIVAESLKNGLILNATGETTLRLLPPLIITRQQVDEAVEILKKALDGLSS